MVGIRSFPFWMAFFFRRKNVSFREGNHLYEGNQNRTGFTVGNIMTSDFGWAIMAFINPGFTKSS